MKRVLLIGVSAIGMGGVDSFWANLIPYIDSTEFNFTFLVPCGIDNMIMVDKMEASGINLVMLGINRDNEKVSTVKKIQFHFKYIRKMWKYLRKNQYDIIHTNIQSGPVAAYAILFSRLLRIPKRVAHSHNTDDKQGMIYRFCRKIIIRNATDLLACSTEAATSMFGDAADRAVILKYGINCSRFAFDFPTRYLYRKKLGYFEKDFVIGHIGRFAEQKNHRFLIEIFRAVADICPEARLMLLGNGELEEEICALVIRYGLKDKVVFAGVSNETEKYYCAMDLFVLPSLYEGFGIVNLEAQASGLYCVVSEGVPQAANVSGKMEFLPLGDVLTWRNHILKYIERPHVREDAWCTVCDAGHDLEKTAHTLIWLYSK